MTSFPEWFLFQSAVLQRADSGPLLIPHNSLLSDSTPPHLFFSFRFNVYIYAFGLKRPELHFFTLKRPKLSLFQVPQIVLCIHKKKLVKKSSLVV